MRALLVFLFALFSLPAWAGYFTDNGNGTVTDGRTGLIWKRCSEGQEWNGTACAKTSTYYKREDAVKLTSSFADQYDWRLPTVRELQSILDYTAVTAPFIDGRAFPATPARPFWSASSSAPTPADGWAVAFDSGKSFVTTPYYTFPVRLVRGGQSMSLLSDARPTSDYVDNQNGTVTHVPTALTWMRCALGQTWDGSSAKCTNAPTNYLADTAKGLPQQTYAGHSDWRLPDIQELGSLVDFSKSSPSINSSMFPWVPSGANYWYNRVWSSTPYAPMRTTRTWSVDFVSGSTDINYADRSVRLVRGSKSSTFELTTAIKPNSGFGTITSTPLGINCGSQCSDSFMGGALVTLTATPSNGGTFTGWSGDCSGTGTCTVTMNAARNVTATFTSLAPQTITFGPTPTIGVGGSGTVSAGASSGLLPVIFNSLTTAVCSVTGTTVTGLAAGTCTIAANQAGNASFAPAPQATQSFIIGKGSQTIAFGAAPNLAVGGTGTVSATASSNLTVTFSSLTTGVCSVTGSTVRVFAAGVCTIAANQGGNNAYNPAPQTTQSINIGTSGQTITFAMVPSIPVGGTGTVGALASSGLPVTFSSLTPGVCTVAGNTVSNANLAAGTCTIAANQAGNASVAPAPQVTQNFTIGKSSQTIVFGTAPSITVGGTGVVSATASSGLPVTLASMTPGVCSLTGITVTILTAGTCTIAASQDGNGSVAPAPVVTQSFGVSATEYYHAGFGHYFVTGSADEAAVIDSGVIKGWARTGQTYGIYTQGGAGLSPVCRFFSTSFAPKSSHFYTPNDAECGSVKTNADWQFEANAFYAKEPVGGVCPSDTVPLYRIYNNGHSGAPNHRYTTCATIADNMVSHGWVSEGVAMCVPGGSTDCATDNSGGGVNYIDAKPQ